MNFAKLFSMKNSKFETIKMALNDHTLMKDLFLFNYKREKISLDRPLIEILEHLKLTSFFSLEFLKNNDPL
jgi:hypothetical protein